MRAVLKGAPPSTLPLTVFVAERQRQVVGFVEVGLRSHADGCDPRRPVGYIEGWFVAPDHRGQDVGRSLMNAAEAWAASQGCTELASDTWIDNEPSQRAHQALGFEIVDRCVYFRKALRASPGPEPAKAQQVTGTRTGGPTPRQGQFLAFIHHYQRLHGRSPAEADMVLYFKVSPPSVHTMVKTLERRGFIAREPGKARSIRLLVPITTVPELE
jgi:aminoglycoside 6'-N-acetyltransferase I